MTDDAELGTARWTHVAIPVSDVDRSIEFYTALTPLVVVLRTQDAAGRGAWLSNDHEVSAPFVLVRVEFAADAEEGVGASGEGAAARRPIATLAPFAHLGIELPQRSDVDAMAERARALGALHWEPAQLAPHVGYVCAAVDPDGNVVEFSWNQKVYATIRQLWGETPATPPKN
jgi:catechol 2,3-dioxygenase-like lactoylglutathione lyase family enzyme